jgi:hypothetical protein
MDDWIDWNKHTPPDDIRGIFILYEDGIYVDRYDYETKKRKFRDSKIVGWRFMERGTINAKSIQCENN